MKPYNLTLNITIQRTAKVYAENDDEAVVQVENMGLDKIEALGDFGELVDVVVTSIEEEWGDNV